MSTITLNKTVVSVDGQTMKGVKNIIKGVKKNKKIDILNFIKLEAKDNKLTVTINYSEYNNDFTITQSFDANVESEGSFLLHTDFIKRITGVKNNSEYTFNADYDKVELIKNGAKQSFNTYDTEEYPKNSNVNFNYIDIINYDEILKLNTALTSISKAETRPILQTVLIRNNKIASTDSHRLYMTDSTITHDNDLIIAPAGIKKLKDIFTKNDSIELSVNENYIKFATTDKLVTIRLYNDGNYPELSRLIPEYPKTEFIINNVDQFKQMIEDAKSIAKESRNNVIKLDIINDQLTMTATHPEMATYENTISIDNFTGEELNISMSAVFLLEGIKQVNSDQLHFKLTGAMRPFIINPVNDINTMSLILPVRTV